MDGIQMIIMMELAEHRARVVGLMVAQVHIMMHRLIMLVVVMAVNMALVLVIVARVQVE